MMFDDTVNACTSCNHKHNIFPPISIMCLLDPLMGQKYSCDLPHNYSTYIQKVGDAGVYTRTVQPILTQQQSKL